MRKRTPALAALAVGLAASPVAFGQALGPADFAVNVTTFPSVSGPPSNMDPTANCTPPIPSASSGAAGIPTSFPAVYTCPNTYSWSQSGSAFDGTAVRTTTGEVGTLTGKCDWNMTNDLEIKVTFASLATISSPTSEVSKFGGSGGQACVWNIAFPSGGSLTGTMTGTSVLDQPNPTTGRFTGTLNIVVVGGTGAYALASGTGTMVQQQEFPLSQPAAPPVSGPTGGLPSGIPSGIPSGLIPGTSLKSSHQADTGPGSSMNLTLRKGKPKAQFVVPSGTINTATKYNLHMAAAPKSKCTVTATLAKTKKTIKLSDKGGKGDLIDTKTVGSRLGKVGKWKLSASCTIPSAPKVKAFMASRTLDLKKA